MSEWLERAKSAIRIAQIAAKIRAELPDTRDRRLLVAVLSSRDQEEETSNDGQA